MTNHVYVRDFIFQDAATSTGAGNELDLQGLACDVNIDIDFSSGSAAGTIKIEESNTTGYAGTWATLATITWAAASTKQNFKAYGTFKILRCRISSAITGGTVTIKGDVN